MKMNLRQKIKNNKIIFISVIFILISIILNIVARISKDFCDWYRDNIFPIIQTIFSFISALIPISVGEIMIYILVIGFIGGLISFIILMIKKKDKRKKISSYYLKVVAVIIAYISVVQTTNCFLLYHCSTFAEENNISQNKYNTEALVELTEIIIEESNKSALNVKRNDDGEFVLTADLNKEAIKAMKNIGDEFKSLDGYYPKAKPILSSKFMSKQNTMGIYFPFSLEANYNDHMYELNKPETVCHELAHVKGWILEDEANFISYMACIKSDNADFIYSGYVGALKYLINAIYSYENVIGEEKVSELIQRISDEVKTDINANSKYWRSIHEDDDGIISSKVISEISDFATDTSLKLNGVKDGSKSYGRMIDLMLNYYIK